MFRLLVIMPIILKAMIGSSKSGMPINRTDFPAYGSLPIVNETIRARKLWLAGHCVRHDEDTASNVLL